MDPRIKGFIKAYLDDYEIESEENAIDFEKFANYCVFVSYSVTSSEAFNVDAVHTGGKSNDTGLDGIGILINGVLVDSKEDVDDVAGSKGQILEVNFIFLQAKLEQNFKGDVITKTADAIRDFFADYLEKQPVLRRSKKIKDKAKLVQYLLNEYGKSIRERSKCEIYYITDSCKEPGSGLQKRSKAKEKSLKDELLFLKDVSFNVWGSQKIEKLYRRSRLQVDNIIKFEELLSLSASIKEVNTAYMGVIKFSEFKKIVSDEKGELMSYIFYDNIRGFLGPNNPVNQDIKNTIDSESKSIFSLLNNGLTIIAKEVTPKTLKDLRIIDYQIVNGCQTSYVLFNSKDRENIDELLIPVKLIQTDDEQIQNDIIKATNYQTKVEKEVLLALSEFPKSLEEFYKQFGGEDKRSLYYERRPGQYYGSSVKPRQIVKIGTQIKTFGGMFLDEPHNASAYKSKLVDRIGKHIFCEKHHPIPYYTSSVASYKLESLFSTLNSFEKKSKIYFHILMVFKYLAGGMECPKFSDTPKIQNYCNKILDVLKEEKEYKPLFIEAYELVKNKAEANQRDEGELFKQMAFSNKLLIELSATNNNWVEKRKKEIKNGQLALPLIIQDT